jgi:hypothetical protein
MYITNNGYRRIQEIGIEQKARFRGRMGRGKRNIRELERSEQLRSGLYLSSYLQRIEFEAY